MIVKKETETKTKMLDGILIDPWKQEVSQIKISHDSDVWRKVLRCHTFDCMALSSESVTGTCMDLWFDDEGRMTEIPSPRFRLNRGDSVGGGNYDFCGYGLIFSSKDGETIGLTTTPALLAQFMVMAGLQFEDYASAKNPRFKGVDTDFIEEKMRNIDLELPGQFELIGTASVHPSNQSAPLPKHIMDEIMEMMASLDEDEQDEKEEEK